MCLYLYVGAPRELPLLPWNPAHPGFHVRELAADQRDVRSKFSASHVYYAGGWEGCGCSFNTGRQYRQFDVEAGEREQARRDVSDLVDYISKHGVSEVYACWAGDEVAEPVAEATCAPKELAADDYFFEERKLVRIAPAV